PPRGFCGSAARPASEVVARPVRPGLRNACGVVTPLCTSRGAAPSYGRMMIEPAASRAGPVLVTGASGFIGSAIVQALGRAGYPVRALVRHSSPRTNLIDTDCDVVEGDIRHRGAVAAALAGARYLVHAAADYRLWAPSADDLLQVNVEGTRIVMQEALRAGI